MYQKIVIPTDGSEASTKAVKYGFKVAQYHRAVVTLVSVLELNVVYPPPKGGLASLPLYFPEQNSAIEELLCNLRIEGELMGLKVNTALRHGDPVAEILEVVEQEEADLLVMAAHSHTPIASLLLGSVSQGVLRQAPCPVRIFGERSRSSGPPAAS